jgi:xanthine dehydrogenase accessory factor
VENHDVAILRTLQQWRAASKQALLATVVHTWGSSPRSVGSVMALCEDGAVIGSVSGGCIEDDLIHRFTTARSGGVSRQDFPTGAPLLVKYGVTADEAHRFGLPCGGTLELLLEFNPDCEGLESIVAAVESGRLVQRVIRLSDGAVTAKTIDVPEQLFVDESVLANTFGPEFRMLLIGAGQLAECLAIMALFCGFTVTVCDPRAEYRGAWRVPGARVVNGMPDDELVTFRPDHRSCVVALTHDPKLDDLALLEALRTDAFYVGAIGSRRNSAERRARLKNHFDLTEAQLLHLRGPVGLYIGSKTPSEIAVSIMAEILAVKNSVRLPREMEVAQAKSVDWTSPTRSTASEIGMDHSRSFR